MNEEIGGTNKGIGDHWPKIETILTVIKVSEKHIAEGKALNCRKCPIALAIKRHGYNEVYVHRKYITIENYRQELPEEAKIFVSLFDQSAWHAIKPFEFKLAEIE